VGDGQAYEVRVSARARRARIELPPGRPPLVVVPQGTSQREIGRLVEQHADWIRRRLSQRVNTLTLREIGEAQGRREARAVVTEVAEAEARRLGVTYASIQIRDQRTRWGSCSPRGVLTFNWRLALAPYAVLDYVVVHELCHLREANHGPGFWRLVEQARPGYREPRTWLRRHGHELLAYAPR
jgi:predicted metal-dependent hydrolase